MRRRERGRVGEKRQTRRSIRPPVGIVVFRQSILAGFVGRERNSRGTGHDTRDRCVFRDDASLASFEPLPRLILASNVRRRFGDVNIVVVVKSRPLSPFLLFTESRSLPATPLYCASSSTRNYCWQASETVNSRSRSTSKRRGRNSTRIRISMDNYNASPNSTNACKIDSEISGRFTTNRYCSCRRYFLLLLQIRGSHFSHNLFL